MKHLNGFLQTYDGFSEGVFRAVGTRVTDINNRILELATQQVEQRVANTLLRLINQAGLKTDVGIKIDFPITRQDISEMTGEHLAYCQPVAQCVGTRRHHQKHPKEDRGD